jgi:hypothetical protein
MAISLDENKKPRTSFDLKVNPDNQNFWLVAQSKLGTFLTIGGGKICEWREDFF